MGSGIFTRKARKRIFHDKIQESSINFTRFSIGKRSNQSANKIIVVGISKVTQFGKVARVKWGRGKLEANNVMREIRVCDGYLVGLT